GYVSPEQALGQPVTPASDVYSLAALAFELLTGERPYAPRTGLAELSAHAYSPVPSASERSADVSPRADAVLARGPAKDPPDPDERAAAFAAALRAAAEAGAGSPTQAIPPPPPPSPDPGARRRRRGALAFAGAAVLAAAAIAIAAVAIGSGGDDAAGGTPTA